MTGPFLILEVKDSHRRVNFAEVREYIPTASGRTMILFTPDVDGIQENLVVEASPDQIDAALNFAKKNSLLVFEA